MAVMPVEIVDIGDVPADEVVHAIAIANDAQSEFEFVRVSDDTAAEMRQHAFDRVTTTEMFKRMEQFRRQIRGYHPFLITVTDSYLDGKKYSNLFGSHRAKEGIAVVTIANVPDIIIPIDRIAAYFTYYFARFTLSFVSPEHRNHEDPRGCVFDRKVDKCGIVDSMRARALCDDCRSSLLNVPTNMSPRQFDSLNQLFALSGAILEDQNGKCNMDNPKPRVFVGSSVEGLNVARAIQAELNHDYHIELWNQSDVFRLGTATLEALETALDAYDYAVFVFTPDDQITKRDEQAQVARDNVIFEAGLFIGRKSRFKAFIVHPRDLSIQLPSDLLGITTAKYESKAPNLAASVGAACNEIRAAIS